ncbi:MAG TPA: hypothetical protein VKP11_11500 [Frankiaceae bacterium]|nr:hypothetical protein [Frankiaceae bacterium]
MRLPPKLRVYLLVTGVTGRVCISGEATGVHLAHDRIIEVLAGVEGRER